MDNTQSLWYIALIISCANTFIIPTLAIAGVWVFKVYLPKRLEAAQEEARDKREYNQATQSDAFKQVLHINEELIKSLVDGVLGIKEILAKLDKMERSHIEDTRLREVIEDVDMVLHRIEVAVGLKKEKDDSKTD